MHTHADKIMNVKTVSTHYKHPKRGEGSGCTVALSTIQSLLPDPSKTRLLKCSEQHKALPPHREVPCDRNDQAFEVQQPRRGMLRPYSSFASGGDRRRASIGSVSMTATRDKAHRKRLNAKRG